MITNAPIYGLTPKSDTAHGAAHCDVLGERRGLLQKNWHLSESLETSLRRAIDDFKLNHEDYIRNYLQN